MLKVIKKQAMNGVMKLMSNPKVMALMTNPKVMGAVSKGFELQGQVRAQVQGVVKALADTLNLATKDEVADIQRGLSRVENQVGSLDAKLVEVKKPKPARKKKAKPTEPSPAP